MLAVAAVYQHYVEFFVSWIPFYFLFKCGFLGLLLVPHTKVCHDGQRVTQQLCVWIVTRTYACDLVQFAHVLYDGFVQPGVVLLMQEFDTRVQPVLESLVIKCVHSPHSRSASLNESLTRYPLTYSTADTATGSISSCSRAH